VPNTTVPPCTEEVPDRMRISLLYATNLGLKKAEVKTVWGTDMDRVFVVIP
jgi:hypothetical protein